MILIGTGLCYREFSTQALQDYIYFCGQSVGFAFAAWAFFEMAEKIMFKLVSQAVLSFSISFAIKDIWFDGTKADMWEYSAGAASVIYILWKLNKRGYV